MATPVDVRFVAMPSPPAEAEAVATALADKGCTGQLAQLGERLADGSDADPPCQQGGDREQHDRDGAKGLEKWKEKPVIAYCDTGMTAGSAARGRVGHGVRRA